MLIISIYFQAFIISFFVAGLIWVLNKILTSDRFTNNSKSE